MNFLTHSTVIGELNRDDSCIRAMIFQGKCYWVIDTGYSDIKNLNHWEEISIELYVKLKEHNGNFND